MMGFSKVTSGLWDAACFGAAVKNAVSSRETQKSLMFIQYINQKDNKKVQCSNFIIPVPDNYNNKNRHVIFAKHYF